MCIKYFDVNVDDNDTILTLSSCTSGGAGRVVLYTKRFWKCMI